MQLYFVKLNCVKYIQGGGASERTSATTVHKTAGLSKAIQMAGSCRI